MHTTKMVIEEMFVRPTLRLCVLLAIKLARSMGLCIILQILRWSLKIYECPKNFHGYAQNVKFKIIFGPPLTGRCLCNQIALLLF